MRTKLYVVFVLPLRHMLADLREVYLYTRQIMKPRS